MCTINYMFIAMEYYNYDQRFFQNEDNLSGDGMGTVTGWATHIYLFVIQIDEFLGI